MAITSEREALPRWTLCRPDTVAVSSRWMERDRVWLVRDVHRNVIGGVSPLGGCLDVKQLDGGKKWWIN